MNGQTASFELAYVPPLDWPFFLRYLGARATPGVEAVAGHCYIRTFQADGCAGTLTVSHHPTEPRLTIEVRSNSQAPDAFNQKQVRTLFDLDADMSRVNGALAADQFLGPLIAQAPGIRIPGAWSPFELLVRTIVGQQVTVRAATTIMGRIVSRFGRPLSGARPDEPTYLFPEPADLALGNLAGIGMPGQRIAALQHVARAVAENAVRFTDSTEKTAEIKKALLALPGIGHWTVAYFALRALRETDAWPATDLVLRRAVDEFAAESGCPIPLERWSPYRGYAAMHLWNHAAQRNSVRR